MVRKIIECVPNFSEGRRREVVDGLAAALTSSGHVALLDQEMDAAHNRCVLSVAGAPEALAEAVVRAVGKAVETIDLRKHEGEHPRMGATDVVPFIPIRGVTMEECVRLSVEVAERIASLYSIPVYLYEQSARVPARQDLAYVRKGEFETLREEIRTHPERAPDFGPSEVHPSAGVTAVGARHPLIAYNIYLHTPEVAIARAIAKAIRHSSGGLRYVKALGFEIKERNQTQVSMNMTHFEGTPLFRVFDMVRREAERYGVSVASSEIVGLVPQAALDAAAEYYLRLEGLRRDQVLENRLADHFAGRETETLEGFVASVAAPSAVPGGGSVAALAGALASALGQMVAGFTEGKKKFASVEARVRELRERLEACRSSLAGLIEEDAAAYRGVMDATKLPKGTAEEEMRRAEALQAATRSATEAPLRTAGAALEVLRILEELTRIGNPNLLSDGATAAQMALAAVKGGQYNVWINLPSLENADLSGRFRDEARRMAAEAGEIAGRIEARIAVG